MVVRGATLLYSGQNRLKAQKKKFAKVGLPLSVAIISVYLIDTEEIGGIVTAITANCVQKETKNAPLAEV